MSNLFSSIKWRILSAIFILNILVIGSYTWYSIQTRQDGLMEQIDTALTIAANNAAFLLSDEDYEAAKNGTFSKEKSDAYQRKVYAMLEPTKIKYIYTFIQKDNGIIHVLDTPEPEGMASGELNGPLHPYEEPSDKLLSAFGTHTPVFDEYTDEWGSFRAIYIPRKTIGGVNYIAGADIPIDIVKGELRETFLKALAIGVILFILSSILLYQLISRIVAPLSLAEGIIKQVADEHNLSLRVEGGNNEIGRLLNSFNNLLEQIAGIVKEVKSTSAAVDYASEKINQGSMSLASRTDTSSASLHQITYSIQEISSTVENTAQSCQEATHIVSEAVSAATLGGNVIQTIANSMLDIHKNSEKVSDIIGLIDSIAFQTNILALNAAVEAARAGEHGRGFAVVATEVRTLAQRSAASAQEIRNLIQTNTEQVNQQNQEVSAAVEAIEHIVGQVQKIEVLIQKIHSSTNAQSVGIHEVNLALGQLEETTRLNADLVKENSDDIDDLHAQIQRLNQLMGIFHVAGEASTTIARPTRRGATPTMVLSA